MALLKQDLVGQIFGYLTVQSRLQGSWLCLCKCGSSKSVNSSDLTKGRVKSCGCKKRSEHWRTLVIAPGTVMNGLTAVEEVDRVDLRHRNFRWQCYCGVEFLARLNGVRSGNTKSCGCRVMEGNSATHRMRRTRVYRIWQAMKTRATNPNTNSAKNYTLRGIGISEDWLHFEAFYRDMGDPPSEQHSIDRVDNDLGYSHENCRWATKTEQARNIERKGTKKKGITVLPNGRFRASIAANGRNNHIGVYLTYDEAVEARKSAELTYWNQND